MQNGRLVRLRIAEAKGVFASFHFKEFKNYSHREAITPKESFSRKEKVQSGEN
jgi:hypothetical protein